MKFSTKKRAVSPIIASLLLIAIAVAAGIIVYVYVNSLAGNLTGSGGAQVSSIVQMQSYDFSGRGVAGNPQTVVLALVNSGGSSVTISSVYFDGTAYTQYGVGTSWYVGAGTIPCTGVSPCDVTITATQWLSVPITNAISFKATASHVTFNDATPANAGAQTTTLATATDSQLVLTLTAAQTPGTTHLIKIITSTGAQEVISVVAGSHG